MIRFLIAAVISFFISGCVIHTYTVRQPRKYTKVSGNRGYIMGTAAKEQQEPKNPYLKDTRPITVWEIDLGGPKLDQEELSKQTENIPYEPETVPAVTLKEEISNSSKLEEEIVSLPSVEDNQSQQINLNTADKSEYQWYTVKKGDTLQKISQKFYQTTKKWKKLFEYNSDILKSPDKIYPGMKIKIPSL